MKKTDDWTTKKDLKNGLSVLESELTTEITEFEERIDIKLEKTIQQVVQDISEVFYEKFEKIDDSFKTIDGKFDRVFRGQDMILGKFENWEIENSVGAHQTRELRVEVDSHEKRIKALESAA